MDKETNNWIFKTHLKKKQSCGFKNIFWSFYMIQVKQSSEMSWWNKYVVKLAQYRIWASF